MLKLSFPETEIFDENTCTFSKIKATTISLEHSLVSISKWESKWHKSYLSSDKTAEELIDYIRCMTITQGIDPRIYLLLREYHLEQVLNYIGDSMTATTFGEDDTPPSNEIVTSELIYYLMIAFNIPMSCEKWHINRLLTLIRICKLKNEPPKKMSTSAILARNRKLNEARRKALKSKG